MCAAMQLQKLNLGFAIRCTAPGGLPSKACQVQLQGKPCCAAMLLYTRAYLEGLQIVRCRREALLEARRLRLQVLARLLAQRAARLLHGRRPLAALHNVAAAAGHDEDGHQRQ